MPEKKTRQRAAKKKSQSSKAGEYVREEMEHIREGKHGARNTKQAIAIGLSKARRAGVKVKSRPGVKEEKATSRKPNPKRSRASSRALKREGHSAASHSSLSRHSKTAAHKRSSSSRSASARKGARTKGAAGRSRAATKAARTRARHGS